MLQKLHENSIRLESYHTIMNQFIRIPNFINLNDSEIVKFHGGIIFTMILV